MTAQAAREATVEHEHAAEPDDFALDLADDRNWCSLMQHQIPADDDLA